MIALLLAATVASSPGAQPAAAETPNAYREPEHCRTGAQRTADPRPKPRGRRLGDQPPANLELAVLRRDARGCPAPVIIRHGVEGDGRAAKPGR